MRRYRYSIHAAARAKERYGDWLDLNAVADLLDKGTIVGQRLGNKEGVYLFQVVIRDQHVRVAARRDRYDGRRWYIFSVYPRKFRNHGQDAGEAKRNRQQYFKHTQREAEEDFAA